MVAGFLHSVAMVGTEKISASDFTSLLVPWLTAMTGAFPPMAAEIDAGSFPKATNGIDVNTDALTNIQQASREQGIGDGLLAPLLAIMTQRVGEGRGSDSLSSLIELVRQP